MSEEYARDKWIDKGLPAREFRGLCQAAAFGAATGEKPDLTYGWRPTTCVDQYAELNPVGRLAVRTAPTFVGFACAAFAAHLPLHWPADGSPMWLPVTYLLTLWVLVTFYDPLAGLWLAARGDGRDREGVAA